MSASATQGGHNYFCYDLIRRGKNTKFIIFSDSMLSIDRRIQDLTGSVR